MERNTIVENVLASYIKDAIENKAFRLFLGQVPPTLILKVPQGVTASCAAEYITRVMAEEEILRFTGRKDLIEVDATTNLGCLLNTVDNARVYENRFTGVVAINLDNLCDTMATTDAAASYIKDAFADFRDMGKGNFLPIFFLDPNKATGRRGEKLLDIVRETYGEGNLFEAEIELTAANEKSEEFKIWLAEHDIDIMGAECVEGFFRNEISEENMAKIEALMNGSSPGAGGILSVDPVKGKLVLNGEKFVEMVGGAEAAKTLENRR